MRANMLTLMKTIPHCQTDKRPLCDVASCLQSVFTGNGLVETLKWCGKSRKTGSLLLAAFFVEVTRTVEVC